MKNVLHKLFGSFNTHKSNNNTILPSVSIHSLREHQRRSLVGWIANRMKLFLHDAGSESGALIYLSLSKEYIDPNKDDLDSYLIYLASCLFDWLDKRQDVYLNIKEMHLTDKYHKCLLDVYEEFKEDVRYLFPANNTSPVEPNMEDEIWQVYRDVIYAVTQKKFLMIRESEVASYKQGDVICEAIIRERSDIPKARDLAKQSLIDIGLPASAVMSHILAISEAITNVLKHAEEGKLTVIQTDTSIHFAIEDNGPGFPLKLLPYTTLMAGYSTKKSLGQGFTLMLKMADLVLLSTVPGQGSKLILVFNKLHVEGGRKVLKRKVDQPNVNRTIQKSLIAALLFEGFWDRWIAHGLDRVSVSDFRSQIKSLSDWIERLQGCANEYEIQASLLQEQGQLKEAERLYRVASLNVQLLQWIYPDASDEKRKWFNRSKELFKRADAISAETIIDTIIKVDGKNCFGRIRVPKEPKACVIIVNPMDSAKEELFTYEMDFAQMGFVTVSFDGPGQGETFIFSEYKASRQRWSNFMNQVIDFTAEQYPGLPIHLFGTSSGGAWALSGSGHPQVCKTVSVSPACVSDVILPDYFLERLSYIFEGMVNNPLPQLENLDHIGPVYMFHGKMDVMVKDEDIYELYKKLPHGKRFMEFEDEGHCCNYKLKEVRQISGQWFLEVK